MSTARPILIAGPTAGGKSAVALALASKLHGAVINADSMQVYRELRLLTARPNADDEPRIPHLLYGIVSAARSYSVGRWLDDVRMALGTAASQGRVPVITGGTGLYFKALLEGLAPVPDVPAHVRERWRGAAAQKDAAALHAMLEERDRETAARVRPSDRQRVVRALEVLDATGRSLTAWQQLRGVPVLAPGAVVKIVIAADRQTIAARINERFDQMIEAGALDEVRRLKEMRLNPDLPAMRALGVPPLLAHLSGDISLEVAVQQAKRETRRYAKRQMTWLRRHMIAWNWLYEQDSESILSKIFSFIED